MLALKLIYDSQDNNEQEPTLTRTEGYENKHKCENNTYFPQIMAYTNFERTVKRIILSGIFYPWSALKKIKPMN